MEKNCEGFSINRWGKRDWGGMGRCLGWEWRNVGGRSKWLIIFRVSIIYIHFLIMN